MKAVNLTVPRNQFVSKAEFQQLVLGGKRGSSRRKHMPGEMNRAEANYAGELEFRRRTGEIAGYAFESIKLKLAPKTFYTPDFAVFMLDGCIQFHEVKGFMEDDAAVKWKVAMDKFPAFKFVLVKGV